jgi:hypothetical protein
VKAGLRSVVLIVTHLAPDLGGRRETPVDFLPRFSGECALVMLGSSDQDSPGRIEMDMNSAYGMLGIDASSRVARQTPPVPGVDDDDPVVGSPKVRAGAVLDFDELNGFRTDGDAVADLETECQRHFSGSRYC